MIYPKNDDFPAGYVFHCQRVSNTNISGSFIVRELTNEAYPLVMTNIAMENGLIL